MLIRIRKMPEKVGDFVKVNSNKDLKVGDYILELEYNSSTYMFKKWVLARFIKRWKVGWDETVYTRFMTAGTNTLLNNPVGAFRGRAVPRLFSKYIARVKDRRSAVVCYVWTGKSKVPKKGQYRNLINSI